MIVLYGQPLSSYTAKLRIALCVRGIAFEEREPPGGYRSLEWRALVPTATLPAIEHDGFWLAESEAILEYLEECFEAEPLLPPDPRARARVRWLARLHDLHVEPRVRAMFPLVRDASQRPRLEALHADLADRIERLAELASPAPYLAGPSFTLADCGFAVTLPLADQLLRALGRQLAWPRSFDPWRQAVDLHPGVQAGLARWRTATGAWLDMARSA